MADYSGNVDVCSIALTDSWIKHPWREDIPPSVYGSFKDFRQGAPFVEAPRPFLGFLIDGHRWGLERAVRQRKAKAIPREIPRITWDGRYKRWQLANGFAFTNAEALEWLRRNGWIDANYKLLKEFNG